MLLAEGKRRFIVEIHITENSIRCLLLILLSYLGGLGMAFALLLQYSYTAMYHIIRFKKISLPVILRTRFLGAVICVIIIILLIPSSNDLLSAFVAGILFTIGYVGILIVFRPLTAELRRIILLC